MKFFIDSGNVKEIATLVPLAGASAEAVMVCAPAFAVASLLRMSSRRAPR